MVKVIGHITLQDKIRIHYLIKDIRTIGGATHQVCTLQGSEQYLTDVLDRSIELGKDISMFHISPTLPSRVTTNVWIDF